MEPPVLKSEEIVATIETLRLRITERFPESGLAEVCAKLHQTAKETNAVVQWIPPSMTSKTSQTEYREKSGKKS